MEYIEKIVKENPSIASNYTAGKTFQNRELRVLVLKTKTSKRAVWIGDDPTLNIFEIFNINCAMFLIKMDLSLICFLKMVVFMR